MNQCRHVIHGIPGEKLHEMRIKTQPLKKISKETPSAKCQPFSFSLNVLSNRDPASKSAPRGNMFWSVSLFLLLATTTTLMTTITWFQTTNPLVFCNLSPPRMFLPLDLLSEYRIQHGAIVPLYVPSSYCTWIFCRGVSGYATDYPCGVWCRGLTTCLLHVGPPFGNCTGVMSF